MSTGPRLARLAVVSILISSALPARAADEIEWLVAPYLWLPDVSLDQAPDGGGGGISGKDLLEKTDAAGMIRVEAARNHWGVTADYLYLSVSDSRDVPASTPPGSTAFAQGDLDLTVFEIAGFFRPSAEEQGINYLVGLRSIRAEKVLLVTPQSGPTQRFDSDESVTDVLFGARYLHRFTDRWDLNLRADYSLGDSEGTWNLLASAGFRFNELFAINLGYRHASLEYREFTDEGANTTSIELSGPLLGFLFRF
jgi:hypothetical protein